MDKELGFLLSTKIRMKKQLRTQELRIRFKKFLLSFPFILLFRIHSSYQFAPIKNSLAVFTKSHRKKLGQVILEYFILFTIIAVLTVIGISTLYRRIQASFSNVQDAAIGRIVNAEGN